MIDELFVGQLVGLVEDLLRRAHLADVVHQRRQAELAQQPALDAERARLAHRQDRHVHHVGERVVVVVAHRRQRHQRGAVLRDGVRQPFDRLQRGRRSGCLRSPRFPRPSPRRHGVRVHLADRGHVAGDAVRASLVRGDAADADVRRWPRAARGRALLAERGDRVHEGADLLGRVTPRSNAMRSICCPAAA